MKTVYCIYLKMDVNIYNEKLKFLISNPEDFNWKNGSMIGLYAWTTKKSYFKEFFELRAKEHFVHVEYEVTDEESERFFKYLKDKKEDQQLQLYLYNTYKKEKKEYEKVAVLSTLNEYTSSVSERSEYMNSFSLIEKEPNFDYMIFKNSIISALDLLLYTREYDINFGAFTRRTKAQLAEDNGTSIYGREIRRAYPDELSVLLFLYKELFHVEERM